MALQAGNRIADDARLLRTSLGRLQRRLRAARGDATISLSAYSALACVYQNGPMSAGQLAAHERLQPQSLTRILAALGKRRLIGKSVDQTDLRRSRIEITRHGIEVLRQNAASQEAWLAKAIAETLTETERAMLRVAAELIDRVSAADPEPSR